MSKNEKIRLQVQEDGSTVWRTLKGEWLVGMSNLSGLPLLGLHADSSEKWGVGSWFVIRSASGKLVVYHKPLLDKDPPASVSVYDSFGDMQPHVPPNVYDEAAEHAGLTKPPQYPELPLEGV